jgi:hypothetical protein
METISLTHTMWPAEEDIPCMCFLHVGRIGWHGNAGVHAAVEQRWMKHRAEDLAEGFGSVRDVSNQIRVMSQFND